MREERDELQKQLRAVEKNLKAKTLDVAQLKQLAHDAQQAKDQAKVELQKVITVANRA